MLDSSGFEVYGEGEWKVKIRGASKRRQWLKLHLGMDEATQEFVTQEVSESKAGDSTVGARLVKGALGKIGQVSADGAYDAKGFYEAATLRRATATVRPNLRGKPAPPATPTDRGRNIARVQEIGLKAWKLESGYSRRSLIETAYSRIKRRFGDKLTSHWEENQKLDLQLLPLLLNRFTRLGMPQTYRVTM